MPRITILESQRQFKSGGSTHWIPKHLKRGRCTPMGTSRCPVGSPQYNLAKTFKKHHGFHAGGGYMYEPGGNLPEVNVASTRLGNGFINTPYDNSPQWLNTGYNGYNGIGSKEELVPNTLQPRSAPNQPVMSPQGQPSAWGTTGGNSQFGMYNWGSKVPTNNPYNQAETSNLPMNFEMDPEQTRAGSNYFGPNPLIDPASQGYGTQVTGMSPANSFSPGYTQKGTQKRTPNGTSDSYLKYLQYAKPVADLYGALDKPARLNANNYRIPQVSPHLLSDEESLREVNNGYYTGLYNLKNSGNYSRGAQVSLAAQKMKQAAGTRERISNANAGILNNNEAINSEINAKNAGTRMNVDQFNIASKSKKNEYLNQLGVDLSNVGSESYIRDKYPEYFKKNARKGGRLYKMKGC